MKRSSDHLRAIREFTQLTMCRLRGVSLRWIGASVDAKVSIGKNFQVDRAKNLRLGSRVSIEHDVSFKIVKGSAYLAIDEFTFIGKGVVIDVLGSVKIGSHTLIAPGCFITDHNHGIRRSLRIDEQDCEQANVLIGNDVWLGANCVILPGVTISNGAVIGAGAVVNRDVGPMEIFAGVPAKKIGVRD